MTEAGDHTGAEARHRAAFTSWDPHAFPRVHMLTWMDLGDSLAAQARADEAVAAWGVEAPNGFLTVIFAARAWDGEPVNAEPRKHTQVAWFPVNAIPAKLVPDRRKALLGYLRSPSEPVVSTDGF